MELLKWCKGNSLNMAFLEPPGAKCKAGFFICVGCQLYFPSQEVNDTGSIFTGYF